MCPKMFSTIQPNQIAVTVETLKQMYKNNSNNSTNQDFNCLVKLNNICSPSNDIKVLRKACRNGIKTNMFKCYTKSCKF